jgi:hypothetical protein
MEITMSLWSTVRLIVVVTMFIPGVLWSVPRTVAGNDPILVAAGELTVAVKRPLTDRQYVAWVRGAESPSTSCNTLLAAPVSDPENRWQTTIQRGSPVAIANGVIVWNTAVRECRQYVYDADPGIYGSNLMTGETYTVTLDRAVDLAIWDDSVVWITGGSPSNTAWVRMGNLAGVPGQDLAEIPDGMQPTQLRFHGNRVLWVETVENRLSARVMSVRPGESPAVLLAERQITWFDLVGDWLVWQSVSVLSARNLASNETRVIASDATGATSTDGHYVVWERSENLKWSTLWAYDLETASRFRIIDYTAGDKGTVGITGSTIRDGVIAWDRWSTDDYRTEIRAAYLDRALPSAAQPNPGTTDPNWTYFPETSHYLAWGFRDFWEASGGLPVFGYPLTEEYIETNADTGADYSVQFTERQRFEWHPENAGTPYQVLLGRLGAEQATDLDLLDDEPFRYRGDDEGPDAGCLYFRETGHYACDAFVFYWREHGLEMGDPGITYRESLALFGYPLSEPFTTTNNDGATVWTQYFERAVFELHLENFYPYRVLLRRLGAEVIDQRGW